MRVPNQNNNPMPDVRSLDAKALADLSASINRLAGSQAVTGQASGVGAASGLWDIARQYIRGPFGMVGDAAIMLARKITESADASLEAARKINQSVNVTTGGNTNTAARLQTYGMAAGVDTDAEAQKLHSRLQSGDPMARMYGLRHGADLTPEPFGEQDYGKEYFKVIKSLRTVPDVQERIREARRLGLEGSGPLLDMSDEMFENIEKNARTTTLVNNPVARKRAADQLAARGLAEQAYENYRNAWGQPWASWRARNDAADAERFNNQAEEEKRAQNRGAKNWVERSLYNFSEEDAAKEAPYLSKERGRNGNQLMENGLPLSSDLVRTILQNQPAANNKPAVTAEEQVSNTWARAIEDNTREMRALGEKMIRSSIGGGDRAKNAVPATLTGRTAFRENERHMLRGGML